MFEKFAIVYNCCIVLVFNWLEPFQTIAKIEQLKK